jgi:CBS domain-containing protein
VRISEVMTESVVTADCSATLREVGELMRDRNVGSVVICDGGYPAALITDRDLALTAVADAVEIDAEVRDYATRPLVTCESEMDIEEAAALMIEHRVRRLPVLNGDQLAGIVTLDDLAVRSGDVELARQMTSEVAKAALPQFYFHQRGG